MKVFFSNEHHKHAPRYEVFGGELITPFDRPSRSDVILESLQQRMDMSFSEPESFSLEPLYRVHDRDYVAFLQIAYQEWKDACFKGEALPTIMQSARTSGKCPTFIEGKLGHFAFSTESAICEGTWVAALASAKVALSAAQSVMQGEDSAFALCRPPGHHCTRNQFGGYCYLNNAAIAAQYCLDQGMDSIAILDFDFHHGNGTQDIFYERREVLYCSVHGDPNYAYPYVTGHADEEGAGDGVGFNVNIPLPPDAGFAVWWQALETLMARIKTFHPGVLVISLGVDAFVDDPQSFFSVAQHDFVNVGRAIRAMELPTIFVMEGGYAVSEIGNNVNAVLDGYGGKE